MTILQEYLGFLNSKPLFDNSSFFEFPQFNIESIKKKPFPKNLDITIQENQVLGKRIEHFFEYAVNASEQYKIIDKNIQVFNGKTTIGEIDFLVQDVNTKEAIHIELVYKFYVYDPTIDSELERWIGPNKKDSLLQKVAKLKTKQLPLLYKNETKNLLETMGLNVQEISQQVCYIGNLFIPFSYNTKKIPEINNQCIVGFWIAFNMFTVDNYGHYEFYIPPKRSWMINPQNNTTWYSYTDILVQIKESILLKKSPLVWIKETTNNSFNRFFITWW
ncbi:DUF1853 family protein [Aquimarina pacifica]|uniref:DUF1853 family protein n=1 Tax=Aquimarina pacifica TaxID=1296415 RepID=UPI00046E9593|nr:DUF1853 family protein [Aquimarina pacifica]